MSNVKPKPKTAPTITGTPEVGFTLIATRGTWANKPTSFHFSWVRCNSTGAACLPIGGATAKIYTLTNVDIGHTIRVNVTARNASGATTATSAATPVIPPSGCPPGTGAIQIATLTPPARLSIESASLSPRVRRSTNAIHLHFKITACGGRPVQGATVFATAVPYNQFGAGQAPTVNDGTVTLAQSRRAGFPASRHQRILAIFVRASKPGEPATSGVSTSRVFGFRFAHH